MSKSEELASQSERVADSRLEDDAYEWSVEADVQLRMCAAELRRLAQVERELEALKASIGDPVAWIVEGQTLGGGVSQYLAWRKSGAGQVPAPLRTEPTPLYAIKEVK